MIILKTNIKLRMCLWYAVFQAYHCAIQAHLSRRRHDPLAAAQWEAQQYNWDKDAFYCQWEMRNAPLDR